MAHSPHLYSIMSRYPSWIMSLFGSFLSGVRVEDTALDTKPEKVMKTLDLVYCSYARNAMVYNQIANFSPCLNSQRFYIVVEKKN